jgi:hypothetical protein
LKPEGPVMKAFIYEKYGSPETGDEVYAILS